MLLQILMYAFWCSKMSISASSVHRPENGVSEAPAQEVSTLPLPPPPEQPQHAPAPAAPAVNPMEAFAQAMTAIAQQVMKPANASVTLKDFLLHKPPTFKGTSDPSLAEQWLSEIERAFRVLGARVQEEDKAQFAAFTFKDEALHWWTTIEAMRAGQPPMTWAELKREFVGRYYPANFKYQMQRQFTDLRQGDKSVSQYVDEFVRLSKYATQMVADEQERAQRFIDGLHPTINQFIEPFGLTTFAKAMETALRWEKVHPRDKGKDTSYGKRVAATSSSQKGKKFKKQSSRDHKAFPPYPCPKCQGNHWLNECKKDAPPSNNQNRGNRAGLL